MLAQNDRAQIMLHCAKFLLLKCQPLGRHLWLAAKKGRWEMVCSSLSVEIFGVAGKSSSCVLTEEVFPHEDGK